MTIGTPQTTSGSYRVLRQLGARAHGTHAAIREPGHELVVIQRFDRRVAIDDGATRYASDAVAREAKCLTKNWHANVARIRHVDVSESELTIATELIDGITLDDFLHAAKVPVAPPMLLRVVLDVLAGLQHIHSLRDEGNGNIPLAAVHGAVCPRNVALGKDGVARLIATFRPRPIRVDAKSECLAYSAPEAIEEATSDARTDLYSVGVMMWEGLQGRALFAAESSPSDVLQKQRGADIKWEADAASIVARLGAVVLRALSFDPALRFRSATEMTAAIRRAAGTEIATGSRVAQRVVEIAGDRIRTRRAELDPRTTTSGKMNAVAAPVAAAQAPPPSREEEPPPTTKGAPPSSDRRGKAAATHPSSKKMPVTAPMIVRTPPSAMKPVPVPAAAAAPAAAAEIQDVTMSMPNAPLAQTVKETTAAMPKAPVAKAAPAVVIAPTASKGATKELPKQEPPQKKKDEPFGELRSPSDMMLIAKKAPAPVEARAADLFAKPQPPSPTAKALRDPNLPKTAPMHEVSAKTKPSPQVAAPPPKIEAPPPPPKVEAPAIVAPAEATLDDEEAALVSIPPTPTEKTPNKALNVVTAPMPMPMPMPKAAEAAKPPIAAAPPPQVEEEEEEKAPATGVLLFLQRGMPIKTVMRIVGIAALLTLVIVVVYLKSASSSSSVENTKPIGTATTGSSTRTVVGTSSPTPAPTESVVIATDDVADASAIDPNLGTGGFYGTAPPGSGSAAPFDPTIAVPAPTTSSSSAPATKIKPYEPLGI